MAACSLHADNEEFVLRYLMLLDIDLLVSLSNCRPLVFLSFISRRFWVLKKNQELMAALQHKPRPLFLDFLLIFSLFEKITFFPLSDRSMEEECIRYLNCRMKKKVGCIK